MSILWREHRNSLEETYLNCEERRQTESRFDRKCYGHDGGSDLVVEFIYFVNICMPNENESYSGQIRSLLLSTFESQQS